MISNSKPIPYINQLLQLGLIDNIKQVALARQVLLNPRQGIESAVYRPYAIEMFNKLIDYCLNDTVMYNRLKQLLRQDHPLMSRESFENLVEKAEKHGVDLTQVIEAYNEGYNQDFPAHLTREQRAFNHANAFVARQSSVNDREVGTTSLTNVYTAGTPGQTVKTIKKALKQ